MIGNWLRAFSLVALIAPLGALALAAGRSEAPRAGGEAGSEAGGGQWAIALHGGAGTIARAQMSAVEQAAYRAALDGALAAGERVLREGGSAIEAVRAAIVLLEDDPLFNAGRGAVLSWEGVHELDASIMDGRDLSAGAIAGVRHVRNPILLADAVRRDGRHVMLSGKGAEQFAELHGLEKVANEWFGTQRRREALERMKQAAISARAVDGKFGTVGVVARDGAGNLAAGTSTGGMTGKRWGRIGDSPIIGAGTYADNRSCAVSATGHGEYFIRLAVAHAICARVALAGEGPQAAADALIAELGAMGGEGGVIVLAAGGEPVFSFNSEGMYRARASSTGLREIAIFREQ